MRKSMMRDWWGVEVGTGNGSVVRKLRGSRSED